VPKVLLAILGQRVATRGLKIPQSLESWKFKTSFEFGKNPELVSSLLVPGTEDEGFFQNPG
jgi:hypothetical protein